MKADLQDLTALAAVLRAGGFRQAARARGESASTLSEAVRRLETRVGVRLINRTTRNVAATEAGLRLMERLGPALAEIEASLDVVNSFRDRPTGTLRRAIFSSRLRNPPGQRDRPAFDPGCGAAPLDL